MTRKQLQENIKTAKLHAKKSNEEHKAALEALKSARAQLVAFDNGTTPAK